ASAAVGALWQVVVLYGIVMTIGANCLGLVVFVPILSRHFVARRGFAIAIVQSANGIARGISAPLVQLAISLVGWRTTYLGQAVLMAAIALPLAGLFRRTDPGAPPPEPAPAGMPPPSPAPDEPPQHGWTLGEAVRTP